jgi:hypothetical protein
MTCRYLKQRERKKEKESKIYNESVDMYMLKYRYIPRTTPLDDSNDYYSQSERESDEYGE